MWSRAALASSVPALEDYEMRALFRRRSLTLSKEDRRLLAQVASRPLTLSENRAMLRQLAGVVPDNRRQSLRSSAFWAHVATVLAALAAIATLGFVALQTRATQKAVQASVWAAATTTVLDFDKALLEHDEDGRLWPYFNDSARFAAPVESPTAAELTQRRFDYLALMQLDVLDGYWGLSDFLPETFIDKDSVGRWMRSSFANSPELCSVLERFQDSYSDQFVTRADEVCDDVGVDFALHRWAMPEGGYWATCDVKDARPDPRCVRP
jgi:hypothetical protein